MYEDLRIIYREYIQNAADSIDKAVAQGVISSNQALIEIDINEKERTITITDNGLGINSAKFQKVMSSIADSEKDRSEDKGFRGIGRLGGISSCEKLRFSCSAVGETTISICTWNAKEVKEILVDKTRTPSAAELVDSVIEYSSDICKSREHFFKVELIGVEQASVDLLDKNKVREYLSAVAPVPYDVGFLFKSKIADFAKSNGFVIDEYQVFVNGERLFKPYTRNLYEPKNNSKQTYDSLKDVRFEIFSDDNGQILAWMWYGVSKFEKQIPSINPMRGIRLRKGNIQIGNENTFSAHGFYDEPRACLYFVGEVFAVSPDLIPNARRDYFNLNSTCREFERQLHPLFYDRFKKIYRSASEYKKSLQKQQDYAFAQTEYQLKVEKGEFLDADDKKKAEEILEEKKKIAEKKAKVIETRNSKDQTDEVLTKVYKALRDDYPVTQKPMKNTDEDTSPAKPSKKSRQYKAQALSQYNKKEQKLIGRIYKILSAILPHDTAETVINKIQEELSK